jgi:hypothetical protein
VQVEVAVFISANSIHQAVFQLDPDGGAALGEGIWKREVDVCVIIFVLEPISAPAPKTRTGQDRTGQDRAGQGRTGQGRKNVSGSRYSASLPLYTCVLYVRVRVKRQSADGENAEVTHGSGVVLKTIGEVEVG